MQGPGWALLGADLGLFARRWPCSAQAWGSPAPLVPLPPSPCASGSLFNSQQVACPTQIATSAWPRVGGEVDQGKWVSCPY